MRKTVLGVLNIRDSYYLRGGGLFLGPSLFVNSQFSKSARSLLGMTSDRSAEAFLETGEDYLQVDLGSYGKGF